MGETRSPLMNDVPESPDERRQRRRARRWKRRARMAGPFLGLPLLVGTLALSVDLIEYNPQPPPERLSDRPIPKRIVEKRQQADIARAASLSTASVVDAEPEVRKTDLELTLEQNDERREFAPPAPYSLRRAR